MLPLPFFFSHRFSTEDCCGYSLFEYCFNVIITRDFFYVGLSSNINPYYCSLARPLHVYSLTVRYFIESHRSALRQYTIAFSSQMLNAIVGGQKSLARHLES